MPLAIRKLSRASAKQAWKAAHVVSVHGPAVASGAARTKAAAAPSSDHVIRQGPVMHRSATDHMYLHPRPIAVLP